MTQRLALGAALLAVLSAAACTSPPKSVQRQPEGPQFPPEYYSKNAKEYMDAGRYGQAKDQWQKQLSKDPDNFMAKVGIAYTDLYQSEDAITVRRDLDEGRKHLKTAEKEFREIWGGQVEADTEKVDPKRPQWKVGLGLALTTRALGYVDHLDSQRQLEIAKRGGPEAEKARNRAAELLISSDQAYADAVGLFHQLAYMQHASPEAIQNLGELYVVTKQDALAEKEFKRYLDISGRSYDEFLKRKAELDKQGMSPDVQDATNAALDAKLQSNARKQVKVMVDLADLAWGRADYLEAKPLLEEASKIQPDNIVLYIKLAQVEQKLDMLESALMHTNEFLRRSSQKRQDFGEDIRRAMQLRAELETRLKQRGGK
jgi:Tfp pilus assembly protein PilF